MVVMDGRHAFEDKGDSHPSGATGGEMLRAQMTDVPLPEPEATARPWAQPRALDVLRWRLDAPHLIDRTLMRIMGLLSRRRILAASGLEHIRPEMDPFILAANHGSHREALDLPALLALQRHGKLVYFMGDWNFRLYPGLNLLYRRSETITVVRKPIPIWPLDRLRPLYQESTNALQRTRMFLEKGRSVGVFPEGTVNTDPDRLLHGHSGAAWLSLRTGVPVVPAGIVNVYAESGRALGINVTFGPPIFPATNSVPKATRSGVKDWHATIMQSIAALCGKDWAPEKGATEHVAN